MPKDIFSEIVADTGDINDIRKHKPIDATTNPTLLLKAASNPEFKHLLADAVQFAKAEAKSADEAIELAMDRAAVNFGKEILKIVPGVVSTEIDARLSFDAEATVSRGRRLIKLYSQVGVPKERVLLKIASTWEGIQAAKVLQSEGINTNLTLLFCLPQAIAAAAAGAYLISPFVGRITDWFKANTDKKAFAPEEDPGVLSLRKIFTYFKKFDIKTVVMGASFRTIDQVLALTGCDKLTIAPSLLDELEAIDQSTIVHYLTVAKAKEADLQQIHYDEKSFRWALNEDQMATEKLSDGIRRFAKDCVALENLLKQSL